MEISTNNKRGFPSHFISAVIISVFFVVPPCLADPYDPYELYFPTQWNAPSSNYTCPDGWTAFGSHCYKAFSASLTRDEADTACMNEGGGRLATPDYLGVNIFVGDLALAEGIVTSYWLGFTNDDTYFLTEPDDDVRDVAIGHWAAGQPLIAADTCVWASADDGAQFPWSLGACDVVRPFVCQRCGCLDGEFFCLNGRCIDDSLQCNGMNDCGDSSDEFHPDCFTCGDVLTGDSGTVTYQPTGGYPPDADCWWVFKVSLGRKVQLQFDSFDTEELCDIAYIYIGGITRYKSRKIKFLSGSYADLSSLRTLSTNSYMLLHFTSNSAVSGVGFQVTWSSDPVVGDSGPLTATLTPQTLQSPAFCNGQFKWTITADLSFSVITLQLLTTDLSSDSSLEVTNKDGTVILARPSLTTTDPPTYYISTSNVVYVEYTSGTDSGTGFSLEYFRGCAIEIENTTAIILAPSGTTDCPVECTWKITNPTGSRLTWLTELGSGVKFYASVTDFENDVNAISGPRYEANSGVICARYEIVPTNVLQAKVSADCEAYDTTNFVNSAVNTAYLANNTLECDIGYTFPIYDTGTCSLNDPVTYLGNIQCDFNSVWDRSYIPTCNLVYCGHVPNVTNGYVFNLTSLYYGGLAVISCDDGYTKTGDNYRCNEFGDWVVDGTTPSCTENTCSSVPVNANMNYILVSGEANKYGSVVEYSCDTGYTMSSGSSVNLCDADGSYRYPAPNCTEICCILPYVANAVPPGVTSYPYGDIVTVDCETGFASSSGGGNYDVTCQINGTFTEFLTCDDVNECFTSPCDHNCINTVGSYFCVCDEGYDVNGTTCNAVDPCTLNPCDGACTPNLLNYTCNCTSPEVIFLTNGTEGYTIAPGETGTRNGDVFEIDHTCVETRCTASDAWTLLVNNSHLWESGQEYYSVGDAVAMCCDLGYGVDCVNVTCQSNGFRMRGDILNCTLGTCSAGAFLAMASPGPPYNYGNVVSYTCNGNNWDITSERVCTFNETSQNYELLGGPGNCIPIDCGQPEQYPSTNYTSMTGTLVGDTFDFSCLSGDPPAGGSTQFGNTTVVCQSNGLWDFGDLRCLPRQCTDPGTPQGGSQDSVNGINSYEEGQVITFSCNRTGFSPVPATVTCVDVGGGVDWDDKTAPECIDTEPPTCLPSSSNIDRYDVHTYIHRPMITDNSGLAILTPITYPYGHTFVEFGTFLSLWQAEDLAGNQMSCTTNLTIQTSPCSEAAFGAHVPPVQTSSCSGNNCSVSCRVNQKHFNDLPQTLYYSCTLGGNGNFMNDDIGLSLYEHYIPGCGPASQPSNVVFSVDVSFAGSGTADDRDMIRTRDVLMAKRFRTYCEETVNNSSPSVTAKDVTFGPADTLQVVSFTFYVSERDPDLAEACAKSLIGTVSTCTFSMYYVPLEIVGGYTLDSCDNGLQTSTCFSPAYTPSGSICFQCPPGSYNNGTNCNICEVGTYSKAINSVSCTNCSSPQTTLYPGAHDVSMCVDVCPVGTYSDDGAEPCSACPIGFYQDNTQQTSCVQCPSGEITATNGSTNASDCAPSNAAAACLELGCDPGNAGVASCMVNGTAIACECELGYTGHQCADEVDYCDATPCYNGGVCNTSIGMSPGYTCDCSAITPSGPECQTDTNDCMPDSCGNGGMCRDDIDSTYCLCPLGEAYTGVNCSTVTEPCSDVTCMNGGICVNLPLSTYQCECPFGYTGRLCENDTDVCTLYPAYGAELCLNGGTCVDGAGDAFTCDCVGGYNGTFCEIPPELCTEVTCSGYGMCYQDYATNDAATCVCQDNFNAGNTSCIQQDLCASSPCVNGSCSLDPPSYLCTCDPGFEGFHCQHSIDECLTANCNNGTCIDGLLGFTCECPFGFSGTLCDTPYDGCGNCVAANTVMGGCVNQLNDYYCPCLPGYEGKNCSTEINYCDSCPCQNGGICNPALNNYTCSCLTGWEGVHCDNLTDNCATAACQNGATCTNLLNEFFCHCTAGYFGVDCGTDICLGADPCINGGTCSTVDNTASCNCTGSYTGAGCECLIDYCAIPSYCLNGGDCEQASDGSFTCICPPGYNGDQCEYDINDCVGLDCGDGTCVDLVGWAYCVCPTGFTGPSCQKETNRSFDLHVDEGSIDLVQIVPLSDNCSTLTIGLWVRYQDNDRRGSFLSASTSSSALAPGTYRFSIDQSGVEYFGNTVNFTTGIDITTLGQWSYITASVSLINSMDARLTVSVAASQEVSDIAGVGMDFSSQFLQILLGGDDFTGSISLVQVWCRALTTDEILAIINSKNIDTSDADDGLVFDWNWAAYNFHSGYRTSPSMRAINTCPFGFVEGLFQCEQNTDLPSSDVCPEEQAFLLTSPAEAISFMTPSFQPSGLDIDSNYAPGDTFSGGAYPVVYNAFDATGTYRADCKFNIFATDGTCVVPELGLNFDSIECFDVGFRKRCQMVCLDGYFPLWPSPIWYTCGPLGTFSTLYPETAFEFPPCGRKISTSLSLNFNWIYDLNVDADAINIDFLQTTLDGKLLALSDTLCGEDCDDYTIDLSPIPSDLTRVVVNISFPAVESLVSHPDCESNLTVKDYIKYLFYQENYFFVPTLLNNDHIQSDSVDILCELTCPLLSASNGECCVECTAGTYFSNDTLTCEPCPIGYYQDQAAQYSCVLCPLGTTTTHTLSTSISDCFANCTPGYFYSNETGLCEPCGYSAYQESYGQDHCHPCPVGQLTKTVNSTSIDECADECHSGYECIYPAVNCTACPVGEYRTKGINKVCVDCPIDWTTFEEASISVDNCSLRICEPGYNHYNYTHCEPCPLNTYRAEDMDNCTACPDLTQYKTTDVGSDSIDDCVHFCEAGYYVSVNGTGNVSTCEPCPLDTYKEGWDYFATECVSCNESYSTLTTNSTSPSACVFTGCSAGYTTHPDLSLEECVPCPPGSYQSIDNPFPWVQCINCTNQTTTADEAVTNSSQCQLYCEAGYYVNGTVCAPCPPSTYKTADLIFATSCTDCPRNYSTQTLTATSVAQCEFTGCDAGYTNDPNVTEGCLPCPYGSYQPEPNPFPNVNCTSCPTGTSTEFLATVNNSSCIAYCPAGYELSNGECVSCPIGEYRETTGNAADLLGPCMSCPDDIITPTLNSTSAANCTRGNCTAGQKTVGITCEDCPLDTYQPNKWEDDCIACDPERGTEAVKSTSLDQCTTWPYRKPMVWQVCLTGDEAEWRREFYTDSAERQVFIMDVYDLMYTWVTQNPAVAAIFRGGFSFGSIIPDTVVTFEALFNNINGDAASILSVALDAETADGFFDHLNDTSISYPSCPNFQEYILSIAGVPCLPGQKRDATTGGCVPCDKGEFQLPTFTHTCAPCPDGTTTNGTGTSGELANSCFDLCLVDGADLCENGGTCTVDQTTYEKTCVCPDDTIGDYCETSCDDYCYNDGVCSPSPDRSALTCACGEDFFGDRCEFLKAQKRGSIVAIAIGVAIGLLGLCALTCCCVIRCLRRRRRRRLVRRFVVKEPERKLRTVTAIQAPVYTPTPVVAAVPTVVGTPAIMFNNKDGYSSGQTFFDRSI